MEDDRPPMSRTETHRAVRIAVIGAALFTLDQVARGEISGVSQIPAAVGLATMGAFVIWLTLRQARQALAWLLSIISVVSATLFTFTIVLRPVLSQDDRFVLAFMFVLTAILPGIYALLLFTNRLSLESLKLTPNRSPKEGELSFKFLLFPVLLGIALIVFEIVSAVRSAPSISPVRLSAVLAMTLIIGFDIVRGIQKNMNTAH